MSRNLLHISQLEQFKTWLDKMAIQHRPGKGDYQILQVKDPSRPDWYGVYTRHHMPEHYSVDPRMDRLVHKFCNDMEKQNG